MNAPTLDLSGFAPENVIRRWQEAFRWANGWDTAQIMTYERGWFVIRAADGFLTGRYRRCQIEAMIFKLETRPRVNPA